MPNRFLLSDEPHSEGMVGGCFGNPGSGGALENLEILKLIATKTLKARKKALKTRTVFMPVPMLTIFGSLLQRAQKR